MATRGRETAVVLMVLAFIAGPAATAFAQRTYQPAPVRPAATPEYARPVALTPTEQEIFERTNDYRALNGLPRVTLNPQLTRAARYFAIYMSITGNFDHDADGKGPGCRATKFGYDWSLVCENIAYRYRGDDGSLRDLPSDFVSGWIDSAGHRKNMLSDEVIETGVGVAVSRDPRHQYSVQVFGKPRGQVYTFRIQNDASAPIRYVLGRQVFTLKPGHTRVHPDSESYPTYFETLDGAARPIPMDRKKAEFSTFYRIVSDRRGVVSVLTGPG
jgi:uncharacterized protein YkwD